MINAFNKFAAPALTLAAIAGTTGHASADSVNDIDLTWSHVGFGGSGNHANVETIWFNDRQSRVYAGNMNWSSNLGDLVTYCIELTELISTGTTNYDIYDGDDATYAQKRWDTNFSNGKVDALSAFWGQFHDSVIDDHTASAFQLGVWELVYDTNNLDVLGSGVFRAATTKHSNGASYLLSSAEIANNWLSQLDLTQSGLRSDLTLYQNDCKQDQLAGAPAPDVVTAVPAPAAFGTGALAMAGMIGRRRRKA